MQDRQRAATPKLQHLRATCNQLQAQGHQQRSANVASLPAMSTASRARQQGGGVRQFPVGRRRYVPVVDAGCGCRPRRPRLFSLPSFLKPSGCQLGGGKTAVRRSGGSRCSSSTSTASFSSSCAATNSTGYSSSAYSSDYYYGVAAATKQPEPALHKAAAAAKKELMSKKQTKKKPAEEAEDGGVGVAVEKESSDPRADFRESMVQMVVEMGLCDWDGLRCMLRRLLALNAPRHHAAILTAFAEVCAQIIAAPAASSQPSSPSPAYHQYRR